MADDFSGGKAKKGSRVDLATLAGFAVALAGILGGLLIEGGKLKDVGQFTAALIVVGGTLGAVMISTPMRVLTGASRRFAGVFLDPTQPLDGLVEEMIGYASKARKLGLVSLEQQALTIADPFLNKALNLAVDGTDLQEIRRMLELESIWSNTRPPLKQKCSRTRAATRRRSALLEPCSV